MTIKELGAVLMVTLAVSAGADTTAWGTVSGTKTASGSITASDKYTNNNIGGGTSFSIVNYIDTYTFTAAADGDCKITTWWTDHEKGYGAIDIEVVGDGHNNTWNGFNHMYDHGTRTMSLHKGLKYVIKIASIICDNQRYSFTVSLPGGGGGEGGGEGGTTTTKPDLRPIVASGFGDSLIVATTLNARNGITSCRDADPVYISWSMGCFGKSITQQFHTGLYVDGVKVKRWYTSSLAAGSWIYVQNYALGTLSSGTHEIKVYVDDEGEVGESNGNNNTVTRTIVVRPSSYTVFFDANGGLNSVSARLVDFGKVLGTLPTPTRKGYDFDGWWYGGTTRVTSATRMTVEGNVTLVAHWKKTVPTQGSCRSAAIAATVGAGIQTARIPLVAEYADDEYDYGSGIRYYRVTLKSGRYYTFATPLGGASLEIDSYSSFVSIEGDYDQSLAYRLVDTTRVTSSEVYVYLKLEGRVGESALLYYSEGNLVPTGRGLNPERIAGSGYGGGYSVCAVRQLCEYAYSFAVDARPGILYDFHVRGGAFPQIDLTGERDDRIVLLTGKGVPVEPLIEDRVLFRTQVPQRILLTVRTPPKTTTSRDGNRDCVCDVRWSFLADDNALILRLDANGGVCGTREWPVDYLEPVGEIPDPVRGGYLFEGWFTSPSGGTHVLPDTLMDLTHGITLYARWGQIMTGSGESTAYPLAPDATVRSGDFALVRSYDGERLGDDGTFVVRATLRKGRVYTFAKPHDSTEFAVSGSGLPAAWYAADDGLDYALVDLTKLAGAGTVDCHVVFSGSVGARSRLYWAEGDRISSSARWTDIPEGVAFTLEFDANDGRGVIETWQVAHGEAVGELPVPTREGWVFDGWWTSATGGGRVTESTVMVMYDVRLYAHWGKVETGSWTGSAYPLAPDAKVRSGNLALVRAFDGESLLDRGAFYAKAALKRGRVYTFAKPHGDGATLAVTRAVQGLPAAWYVTVGGLDYVRVDLSGLGGDSTVDYFVVFDGAVGTRSTLYWVEGDYVP